ncbi:MULTISPECIES: NERD domain-containing protein [Clostridia]|uniref:NERD domain-containing protein n=1 Tax=Clostridia TaxID=186801 RepID=UPI000E525BAD|nr:MULTISPECIES: NERD domain-containing protein [Clostridia]RHV63125.1 DNA-binding protein [Roseburia sp. OM02-15]
MGKSLLDCILDKVVDKTIDAMGGKDAVNGKVGEAYTARELKLLNLFGKKGKVLRNVYIPKDNNETSEVDVLFITQKGIFVIESKNYSGWIFGNENQYKWTMMLPNKETYSFYNPIKQNQTHMKWLKNYIGADIPLFSLIVFSERCELKKVTVENQDIQVINRDRTYATVRDIWNKKEDILSNEEVKVVYQKLKKLTNVTKEEKEIHIQDIKEKYDEISGDIPITVTDEKAKSCPRCGSMLVLRTAKKGTNAGKQFWGCSAFPKCRYVKNV